MSAALSGSFADNLTLPIHRWFRYSAGFSGQWAEAVIAAHTALDPSAVVLDPFCGSGTVMIASDKLGRASIGIEPHPFVSRIARIKTRWAEAEGLADRARALLASVARCSQTNGAEPELLQRCYDPETLSRLRALQRGYHETIAGDGAPSGDLIWLAITSILRKTARVGTAQWQYVLPRRSRRSAGDPFALFQRQIEVMVSDIGYMTASVHNSRANVFQSDARGCAEVKMGSIGLVLTSPPYANNYDYADAVRLEMTFWGDVTTWGDLHDAVRKRLIVSSSQHASTDKLDLNTLLADPGLQPVRPALLKICRRLEQERLLHGGRKHYHTMVAGYFRDMSRVWAELRRMCRKGASVCFVIGDSAPYGIHVPVEGLLAALAEAHGFVGSRFEKIRDRNVKWKNRKHRVPLQEGRLWVSSPA